MGASGPVSWLFHKKKPSLTSAKKRRGLFGKGGKPTVRDEGSINGNFVEKEGGIGR